MRLKASNRNCQKGFSLVELIAAVAVFLIITTIVLVKHSEFSGTLLVENLAYDIALSVRKAQVFGLSVREFEAGSSEFNVGYGIHFESSDNKSYIFFADRNRNEKYDDSSEIIETLILRKGNIISEFCGTLANGTEKCSPSDLSYLDIVFERPNPDAIIKGSIAGDIYASAKVTVRSPQGTEWNINTIITGQISVQR